MTFGKCLYTLILMPLQLLFEVVYSYAYRFLNHPGLAIIALSLAINFLVLPLYRRADAMQEEQRDTEAKLHDGVAHIRKAFHGDERTMMLQTYYRQNHYSPVSALRGATSLLLEIPFFIAAYRFLSNLTMLIGVSFGPIADLSQPDGLLVIGGLTINLLPIIMTAINFVSSAIFTKGAPKKEKLQLYAMALFFLVFLYTSPSGLVFYWTLNNAFSLIKTVFYKLKDPRLVLSVMAAAAGLGLENYAMLNVSRYSIKWLALFVGIGIALCLPLIYYILQKKHIISLPIIQKTPNKKCFAFGALYLTILTGTLIPSAVIASSPQEFVEVTAFRHPMWYVASSSLIAFGVFLIWMGVFYWLASPTGKIIFETALWVFCGIATVDYMFFGKNKGNVGTTLFIDGNCVYSGKEQLINLLVIGIVALLFAFLVILFGEKTRQVLLVATIAICGMSIINTNTICKSISQMDVETLAAKGESVSIRLSKTGKNVVVLMLDRALGEYIPYIFEEKPELKEQFSGFTYYSNVMSYGGATCLAAPALYGGYEYTPIEINKRDTELLDEKQKEAERVMPTLFYDKGYDVTIINPPYSSNQWLPNLPIYDEPDNLHTYYIDDSLIDPSIKEKKQETLLRNFIFYSFTKISPLSIQGTIHESGNYHRPMLTERVGQSILSRSIAYGINYDYLKNSAILEGFIPMTQITENDAGAFFMFSTSATHEPTLLQKPDYSFTGGVDNTEYDTDIDNQYIIDGKQLKMEDILQNSTYHVNVATLTEVGNWLDYLKENNLYDNTRIIIVSDHGSGTLQLENFIYDETAFDDNYYARSGDLEYYFPLLMVKDFGSDEFTTCDDFMTNADVPLIALQGIVDNPVNPYSGKQMSDEEKYAHEQLIVGVGGVGLLKPTETTYGNTRWYSVHDNIWDKSNWKLVAEDAVLP